MDMRNPSHLNIIEMPSFTGDPAAPMPSRSATAARGGASQELIARSIDAGVREKLSVILEGIGDAFYILDRDWRFTYINRAAETFFGAPRETMLGRLICDVFPQSKGTELYRRYKEVAASGVPASFESAAVSAPGRHVEFHVFPYDGGLGVSFRDWTERRRAEEALRESQAQLSSLTDNLPACMVYQVSDSPDFRERQILYLSKSSESLIGIPAKDVQADPNLFYDLILPAHRERMIAQEIEAHHERKSFDTEIEMRHGRTGEVRWHRLIVTPRQLCSGGYIWDGVQIDITEHKRAEEHMRLMINELNHRVKNTLATVQSLATQSFRPLGTVESDNVALARKAFEARLFALARGHDILTRENWEGASLAELASHAFAPFRSHPAPEACRRIALEGPDLRVAPAMALSLSMALHELCTNALKYGALGASGGSVRISWDTYASPSGQRLVMRWEEHGGPPVSPPTHKGFGSRMIQDGLARELNGTVSLAYEPAGVICTIDVPLS